MLPRRNGRRGDAPIRTMRPLMLSRGWGWGRLRLLRRRRLVLLVFSDKVLDKFHVFFDDRLVYTRTLEVAEERGPGGVDALGCEP